jgi:type IV pilus assembly protein PilN
MRITLNLATRPFADLGPAIKRLRIAMGVLAALSIGLGFGLHVFHHRAELARARDHSLDGAIAHITQERQGYIDLMHQPPNAQLLAQSGMLNQLFDEKSFSWTLAMEDLETVLPGGVQVSSLEPVRAKEGQITLHLRVIGPRDREVELVQNLEHSRRFISPRIVGENAETSGGGPNQPMEPVSASNRFNFDLLAEYNPAAPGERRPAKTAAPAEESPAVQPEKARGTARPAPAPVVPTVQNQAPGAGQRAVPVRPPYVAPRPARPIPRAGGPQ